MPAPPRDYLLDELRFDCDGLDCNAPVDQCKPRKYPFLENVRSYQTGRIEPRVGLQLVGPVVTNKTPVHSCRRLNDDVTGTWTRILGVEDRLAYGQGVFTNADGAYSGNPLALCPLRPDQSPNPWMYVGDSSRMRKIKVDGTVHTVGLPPPLSPPGDPTRTAPAYKEVTDFESATGWAAASGSAGISAISAAARVNTTISNILFDSGTTGWACINPAAMTNINSGMRLHLATGGAHEETVTVDQVHRSSTTIAIGRILYDSGTSGACSIALDTPLREVQRDSLILIAATEYVRVLSVTLGPNGQQSIRCVTTATRSAGDAVVCVASFRAYCTVTHAAAETVQDNYVTATFASGTNTLELAATPDLSLVTTGIPVTQDEYMHIAFKMDAPEALTELKLLIDVDAATNDFTRNYYYKSFRAADITPVLQNTAATLDTNKETATNQLVDSISSTAPVTTLDTSGFPTERAVEPFQAEPVIDSGFFGVTYVGHAPDPTERGGGPGSTSLGTASRVPPENRTDMMANLGAVTSRGISSSSLEAGPGDSQWSDLTFKIADLIRVGTDEARGLKNVIKIGFTVIASASVEIQFDGWWVGGGYGPDIGELGDPYLYRYRGRVSSTGAKSNFSPPTRGGVSALRQQCYVPLTQHPTTECDKLDIERWGGSIRQWTYVGTVANGATPSFTDSYGDDTIDSNPQEGNVNFQPWPTIDIPRSGTLTDTAGTTIRDSGTSFNLSWAPGTKIQVNGIYYTIYKVISTSRLEIYENADSQGSVAWNIYEPVLMGQPLPVLFGPYEGFAFACGDPNNPGVLYWTNGNNPDGTRDTSWLEVTSPSEPLQNGCVYNGLAYIWSSERMFAIYPSSGANLFKVVEVPGGRGLFSRWALACPNGSPAIWFLSKDGIYETTGGAAVSITDADLLPLFPNEGNLGQPVNGINPPNIIISEAAKLRLNWYDGYLYFDYRDTTAALHSLVCSTIGADRKWWFDTYTPGVVFHYGDEGANQYAIFAGGSDATTGNFYQQTGYSDNGTAIACSITTPSFNQGVARTQKVYGDFAFDINSGNIDVTITAGFNLNQFQDPPITVNTGGRASLSYDINGGLGQIAFDVCLDIAFSVSTSARPLLYVWTPSYILRPDPTVDRATDWDGTLGADPAFVTDKYFRGMIIEADTGNIPKPITIQRDGGIDEHVLVIQHQGQIAKPYALDPFNAHTVRMLPTDSATWRLYRWKWIYDDYPELASITTAWELGDYQGAKWLQGMVLNADSANLPVELQIQYDGGSVVTTVTATHNGQVAIPYSWIPVIVHNVRIVPMGPIRIFSARWIWEPEPELAAIWYTQGTTHDLSGYQHIRDAFITLLSNDPVTLTIDADGTQYQYQIDSTGGVHRKVYVPTAAIKGKLFYYTLIGGTSTGMFVNTSDCNFRFDEVRDEKQFRLFKRDCEVRVKPWGSEGPFAIMNPFGDVSRIDGARI